MEDIVYPTLGREDLNLTVETGREGTYVYVTAGMDPSAGMD